MMFFAVPRLNTTLLSSDKRNVSKRIVLTVQLLKENAVKRHIRHILHVDLDNNKLWTTVDVPDIDELAEMAENKENEYDMPRGFRLIDVEFPDEQKETSGVVRIRFYKKGYSDYAMIHLEDDNANMISYEIEPFLHQVQIHERYVEF